MRALVLVAVVAVTLSGCSGSGGLTTYILQPGDTTDCTLTPMSDDDMQEAKQEAGLTGNPGRVDNELLERGDFQPIDNLVSLYECDDGQEQAFSQAMRFADATDAAGWLEASQYCQSGLDGLLQDGPVLAMAVGPGHVESAWHTRVANQTAAAPAC